MAERLLTTLHLPVVPLWLHTQPALTAWWRVLPLLLRRPIGLPGELLALRGTTVQVLHGRPAPACPTCALVLRRWAPSGEAQYAACRLTRY